MLINGHKTSCTRNNVSKGKKRKRNIISSLHPDKCNFYMIFIILLFIKIFNFPLFLLIWFDFYLYLSIHLCFEGMRRFQINLQGLYMQSGARPIESSQLTSSQAWIQEKTNPIKFKSNWSKESKEICTKSKSNSN